MKVYVLLTCESYESSDFFGVFSTREKAETHMKRPGVYGYGLEVKEHTIDEGYEWAQGYKEDGSPWGSSLCKVEVME